MADQAMAAESAERVEIEGRRENGRLAGKNLAVKTLVLFVIPAVLVLGGAGAYFAGLLDPEPGSGLQTAERARETAVDPDDFAFYELPEFLVNLDSGGGTSGSLKISVSLELRNEDAIGRLEAVMPRIIDNFQVYLRALRIEDLSGAAGRERLREALLLRINAAVRPHVVSDVLFKEMVIQ